MKNKAFYASMAIIPAIALSLIAAATPAFAKDSEHVDMGVSAETNRGDLQASTTINDHDAATGRFTALKGQAAKIENVVKEKIGEHGTATGTLRLKDDFMANLKIDRDEAFAQLKLDNGDFMSRMKLWRQKMASTSAEIKVKLDKGRKISVESVLGSIIGRFNAAAGQMGMVSARLATKITDTENDSHINMDASAKLLADADAKLSIAKDDITAASTTISADLNATTTSSDLKSAVATVKSSLKDAFDAYKAVIKSIRDTLKANATTTASTTASI